MKFVTFLDEEGAVDCNQPENSDLDLWTIKLNKQITNASDRIKQSVMIFPLLLRECMILQRIVHACICG